MTRNFFSRISKVIIILAGSILLLFILSYTQMLTPVYSAIRFALAPIQKHIYIIGSTLDHLFINEEQKNTQETVKTYEQRISDLEIENARLKVMIGEATVLAEQLTFLKEEYAKREYVISHVISKDAQNTPIMVINKGVNDGVYSGYPVITDRGVLIGKVIESYATSSKVMLLTHNQSHVAATLLQETEEQAGIISGDFQLSLMMEFVPKHISIQQDDIVITSGLEDYIPKGLVIGRVREVTDVATNVFKEISIEPLVNYDKLSIVSVLKP